LKTVFYNTELALIMLSYWLKQIPNLLKFAPHGFMAGCGETSLYLAYACRTRPQTEAELFQRLNRKGEYENSELNEVEYSSEQIQPVIEEIKRRLSEFEYVRISLTTDPVDDQKIPLKDAIVNPPPAQLYDHSFLLVEADGFWRYESYLGHYPPRAVEWRNWEQELLELIRNPVEQWEKIFQVSVEQISRDLKIILSN
jgi:hypothetical protein